MLVSYMHFAIVLSPPPQLKACAREPSWVLESITLAEALPHVRHFESTYPFIPEFAIIKSSSYPQGLLAFKKGDDVRLIIHFWEKHVDVCSLTSIACSQYEDEAQSEFIKFVNDQKDVQIDMTELFANQPKWKLLSRYYNVY